MASTLYAEVELFLNDHHCPATFVHVVQVAVEATCLARRFGVDPEQAEQAALLHDISAVIPNAQRVAAARAQGLAILPEEEAYPVLLHQQLSVILARERFGVTDEAVLSAIGCHTTLRPRATPLDQVVFIADKIAWDQAGHPPYQEALSAALEHSLSAAARVFLEYLRLHASGPLHPWARQALSELSGSSE